MALLHVGLLILLLPAILWGQAATLPARGTRSDDISLALEGGDLSAAAVEEREQRIAQNPADVESRIMLLGNYFTRRRKPQISQKRLAHVLWMIENESRREFTSLPYCGMDRISDPTGFAAARAIWTRHIEQNPAEVAILGNAASFFAVFEPETAEQLLKKCKSLEPTEAKWPQQLAAHYRRAASFTTGTAQVALRRRTLEESEAAYRLSTDPTRKFYQLQELTRASYEAGQIDQAAEYAALLLSQAMLVENASSQGNAVHHGNLILGRVALAKGDVASAKTHLLAAGKTPGSPQLNSFGPNMQLARELIEKGERETVIEYLTLCRVFWGSGGDRLDTWTRVVKDGGIPDFGANLVY